MAANVLMLMPYFGRWPAWFRVFLKTCEFNPSVRWLFFTDCAPPRLFPENVEFIPMDLPRFNSLASRNLDLQVNVKRAFKLCDLRPAFGVIFRDYLGDCDFWGYGDIDVIYGDIRKFINNNMLSDYDIITTHEDYLTGPFTLFRNNERMNRLYEKNQDHKRVFGTRGFFGFDENADSVFGVVARVESMTRCVKRLAESEGVRVLFDDLMRKENSDMQVNLRWTAGRLEDLDQAREFLYYHFVKLKFSPRFLAPEWTVVPNAFLVTERGFYFPADATSSARRSLETIKYRFGLSRNIVKASRYMTFDMADHLRSAARLFNRLTTNGPPDSGPHGPSLVGKKFFLVTRDDPNAGFFAYVTFALNQLILCEKHGLTPVVYLGQGPDTARNPFYDPKRGENVWEYYFEPVAGYSYSDLQEVIEDPEIPVSADDVVALTSKESIHLHLWEPESVFNYPYGYHRREVLQGESWYETQRQKARDYLDRYVRVRRHILEEADQFQRRHFQGRHVLGVHIRGTDKGTSDANSRLMRIVKPIEYFPLIDDYTSRHGPCKIFVATDQTQCLQQMKEHYGQRIISCDATRSGSQINPFQEKGNHGYVLGKEVLLDCLLLSRCDYLIRCTSAVGEYAVYFNPELRSVDVNHAIHHRFHKLKTMLSHLGARINRVLRAAATVRSI